MPDGPESAGAIPPRCRCAEAPEAWQKCPLPQHDHAKWAEHGWNCPPSCQNPDALAAKVGPMPDGPSGAPTTCNFCGAASVVTCQGRPPYGLCADHLVRATLTEAWQVVNRAVTPLGYGGDVTNSPWNTGYEQAKNEALNALLALRDRS